MRDSNADRWLRLGGRKRAEELRCLRPRRLQCHVWYFLQGLTFVRPASCKYPSDPETQSAARMGPYPARMACVPKEQIIRGTRRRGSDEHRVLQQQQQTCSNLPRSASSAATTTFTQLRGCYSALLSILSATVLMIPFLANCRTFFPRCSFCMLLHCHFLVDLQNCSCLLLLQSICSFTGGHARSCERKLANAGIDSKHTHRLCLAAPGWSKNDIHLLHLADRSAELTQSIWPSGLSPK